MKARLHLHVLLSGGSSSQLFQEQSIKAQQSNIAKYRVLDQTQCPALRITNKVLDCDESRNFTVINGTEQSPKFMRMMLTYYN